MSKYFQLCRSFLEVNGNLFEVVRETSEERDPEEWKKILGADIVFRKEGKYYFSKLIPEAELASELEEQPVNISSQNLSEEEIVNLVVETLKKVSCDSEGWQDKAAREVVETLKRLYE